MFVIGKNYILDQKLNVFTKADGKEKLKDLLKRCCDNDFNGDNGEEYYIIVNKDGKETRMSKFEAQWLKAKNNSEKEIIKSILDANYKNDSYYYDYNLKIIDRESEVIFSYSLLY